MPLPLAHETWFELGGVPGDRGFVTEALTLALLAAAVVVTVVVRLVAALWPGVDVRFLARMAPWMPFAMRLHLAVSSVGLLSLGVYRSPAMDLQFDVLGVLLVHGSNRRLRPPVSALWPFTVSAWRTSRASPARTPT